MSVLIKGVRFPTDDVSRTFGYLAVFSDGDVKKHATRFAKTHCVRAVTNTLHRWQSQPILANSEIRDGMQLHHIGGGYPYYEWFKSEAEAAIRVRQALALTFEKDMMGFGSVSGQKIHPLNEEYAQLHYWASVEIVPVYTVWNKGDSFDQLRELADSRLTIGAVGGSLANLQKALEEQL